MLSCTNCTNSISYLYYHNNNSYYYNYDNMNIRYHNIFVCFTWMFIRSIRNNPDCSSRVIETGIHHWYTILCRHMSGELP